MIEIKHNCVLSMMNGIGGNCLDELGIDGVNVSETKDQKHKCNCCIIQDCSVLSCIEGGHPESWDCK